MIFLGYDITVVKELLGYEDIKTTLVYAKANSHLLRDATRSFEQLGNSGYKMVTQISRGGQKLLEEKSDAGTDDSN